MNIEPKDGSSIVQPSGTQATAQTSARDRAIAKLMAGAPVPQSPVANPSQVSPEEMSVVSTPSRQSDTNETSNLNAPADTKAAEEPISSQYAVLARKEKALRLRDQQLRQREAAIKASEAPKAPSAPTFDESKYVSKDRLEKDPFGALAELGLDYSQLTDRLLNSPSPEAQKQQAYISKLESRLEALESGQTKVQKTFEEREVESRKQAVSQIRSEVGKLVMTDPQFETIKETRSLNDVVELIEKTFDEDGILLTVEEAAQQVEDYLVDEAMKIAKIKKIQLRLAAGLPATAQTKQTDAPKQQQLKTLTNSVSSSRPLTSKERAILAFQGKLNK